MGANAVQNKIFTTEKSGVFVLQIFSKKYGIVDTLFSGEDLEKVQSKRWCVSGHGTWHYVSSSDGSRIRLSRYLLDAPKEKLVDHKNGNTLDNTRENIRLCTYAENAMNRTKSRFSNLRGIHLRKDTGKYRVYLILNKVRKHFGSYSSLREAILVYNEVSKLHYGEFATSHKVPND